MCIQYKQNIEERSPKKENYMYSEKPKIMVNSLKRSFSEQIFESYFFSLHRRNVELRIEIRIIDRKLKA